MGRRTAPRFQTRRDLPLTCHFLTFANPSPPFARVQDNLTQAVVALFAPLSFVHKVAPRRSHQSANQRAKSSTSGSSVDSYSSFARSICSACAWSAVGLRMVNRAELVRHLFRIWTSTATPVQVS